MRLFTVLLGVLTALVIVLTQLFYFELSESAVQNSETEQQNSSSSDQENIISLPSSYSLPASAHVDLNHEFTVIKEILFDVELLELPPVELQASAGRLFKALFHFIISPNAP